MRNAVVAGVTIVVLGFTGSALGRTAIRADDYRYEAEKITYRMDETFVITSLPSSRHQACGRDGYQDNPTVTLSDSKHQTCTLPVPHFALDSDVLTPAERDRLLINIQACHIGLDTPVYVTGHTCRLGTEAHNYNLSLRRADRVAELLRKQGYTIGEVTGKGPECPVAGEDHLELNRRVEVMY